MRTFLLYHWEAARTSYWFLPAMLSVAAVLLAQSTLAVDEAVHANSHWVVSWAYSGGPEGARAVLSTIAGSMITVAGVVFSITIVALSLASAQFGPRLLRNFIRDAANQFVLGTFTATFLFCLLVLRKVRGTDEVQFVPGISVTVGILLAMANLGVLVYFIHHVAISIQANHVLRSVNGELTDTIDRLWPDELGENAPQADWKMPAELAPEMAVEIESTQSGYIDFVEADALLSICCEHDLVVQLLYRPGHFIVQKTPLILAWPAERAVEGVCKRLQGTVVVVAQRTPYQDIEFAIDQLVEVAVRALSPGVNDPFTAIGCIHRLGEALCRLSRRSSPSPGRFDAEGNLRVVTPLVDFRGVADAAFNQIRQNSGNCAAVLFCLLETLTLLATVVRRQADRDTIGLHAELVIRAARRDLAEDADIAQAELRYDAFQAALTHPRHSPRSK